MAILHIVAHALYKAHAFLSSGSIVEVTRATAAPAASDGPRAGGVLAGFVLALALYAGIGWSFGLLERENAAVLTLGAIVVMGLAVPIALSLRGEGVAGVVVRVVAGVGGATVAYFVLQSFVAWLMMPVLPPVPEPGVLGLTIMGLAVISFAAVTAMQLIVRVWASTALGVAARIHVANGFYANLLFNRLIGADKRLLAHPFP